MIRKKKTIGASRNTGMNKNTFNKLEELEKKKKRKSDAKKLRKSKKISEEKHTDIKSHNYKISISGVGNEVLKNLIKQVETEIKALNFFFKKLKPYYKERPVEFNEVCHALKYKAEKVQEIVEELRTKYNSNR